MPVLARFARSGENLFMAETTVQRPHPVRMIQGYRTCTRAGGSGLKRKHFYCVDESTVRVSAAA
jgi:hypothetical protein